MLILVLVLMLILMLIDARVAVGNQRIKLRVLVLWYY